MRQPIGFRWWIAALLFFASLLNFLNRLIIAVLGPVITVHLGLSNTQFATLTTWFLVAYTLSQGLSGGLYDRIGSKLGFTLSIIVWSLASIGHAFSHGLISLNCFRFALGLGEGGSWPGAAKVIAEWFPVKERALGMGIFNSGATLAAVIAPPLIVWMELRFGWQSVFVVLGAAGFAWLALWLIFYHAPESQPETRRAECELALQVPNSRKGVKRIGWGELMRRQELWAIVLSRFFADPVWWLYITWLPLYLFRVRHFSLLQIGAFAWAPFVAADAGSLVGGWSSGYLIGRGWTVNRARKSVIVAGMLLMVCGIPAVMVSSAGIALGLIAVVLFGFQGWISNVQTLCSDYFPDAAVGSVMGMGGVGAGIGAMLFTQVTGVVVDHYSYAPILIAAGLLPIVATAMLFSLGKSIHQLSF